MPIYSIVRSTDELFPELAGTGSGNFVQIWADNIDTHPTEPLKRCTIMVSRQNDRDKPFSQKVVRLNRQEIYRLMECFDQLKEEMAENKKNHKDLVEYCKKIEEEEAKED